MILHAIAVLPETPQQWIATLAMPALMFTGTVAVICWARYLIALHRLQLSPGRTALALREHAQDDYATAYRFTVGVIVVLTIGLAAAALDAPR